MTFPFPEPTEAERKLAADVLDAQLLHELGREPSWDDAVRAICEARRALLAKWRADADWLTRTVLESVEARKNVGVGVDALAIRRRWGID